MLFAPQRARKLIHGSTAVRPAVFLVISILTLSACGGGGGSSNLPLNAFNKLPDSSQPVNGAATNTQPANTTVTPQQISTVNAGGLASSSLEIIAEVISIGNIATAMVTDGASLLTAVDTVSGTKAPMSQCPGQIGQLTFQVFQSGNFLPAGKDLNAMFSRCTIEHVLVTGSLDISAIKITGTPGNSIGADWRVSGLISLNGLTIQHQNSLETVFTNQFNYSAAMVNGVLTSTLDIPNASNNTGGINAEQIVSATNHLNYLVAPFFIIVQENKPASRYSITVIDHPTLGPSKINRYTSTKPPGALGWQSLGDDTEVLAGTPTRPFFWQQGKPDIFATAPVDGEIILSDTLASSSVTVTIRNDTGVGGVVLSIDDGTTVTSQFLDWQKLLNAL